MSCNRTFRSLYAVLSLVLLVGLAGPVRAAAPTPTASIDQGEVERYRQWVERLTADSMEGRGPETEGITRARDALADALEQYGLDPAFGDAYTQPFKLSVGVQVDRASLSAGGQAIDDEQWNPLGFSASGRFEGEAVFVGYGVRNTEQNYDSYGGIDSADLEGKIFVIYRYEPMDGQGESLWAEGGWTRHAHLTTKAELAAKQGAAAVIIVNPPSHAETKIHSAETTSVGGRVDIPIIMAEYELLADLLNRAGRDNPRSRAERWQHRADESDGWVEPLGLTVSGQVQLRTKQVKLHNVAAVAPGVGELAEEHIVIGAHYDHIGYGPYASRTRSNELHPGADDNASGTAAVWLLARRYAKRLGADDSPKPRRSVLFIGFSGEERGLIGSTHFVRHLEQAGLTADRIVAMINLDMVGRLEDGTLHATGGASSPGWEERLRQAGQAAGVEVELGDGGFGGSDHVAFHQAEVPAIHLFTGLHDDYHTPRDTADKIDAAGGVKVVDVVDQLIRSLRTGEAEMPFEPVRHAGRGHGDEAAGGIRAYLGIMPDYTAGRDAANASVQQVTPDSPAAKAGLEAGDRIVAWAGEAVDDLYDLTDRLREAEPGRTVTLTVQRGEQTRKFDVTLGER